MAKTNASPIPDPLPRRRFLRRASLGVLGFALQSAGASPGVEAAVGPGASGAAAETHPRLYFTAEDLPRLRSLRRKGVHARIWKNLRASAEACLKLTPRAAWIAPVQPDPVYENLYDRFYAIMGDLATTEHLSFAYSLSGEQRYAVVAKQWVLASCRAWRREADGEPDGGKAYAVCRLLKGLAVGYDALFSLFTDEERREVRGALAGIGDQYYRGYFTTERVSGSDFHTHHAVVEWASFGVAALALLHDHGPAEEWLAATVRKFERHLLPEGLAPDGAQVEGSTFWASTMQYRLFFMDALRRVTGRDLYTPHAARMNADLALASIAAEQRDGLDDDNETVILEPSYGQLDYYAPVLLALAREYRRPLYQHLALWDHTLGALQETRYVTPHGERLRFEMGGYAYLWYDPTVQASPSASGETPRHFHFPSVEEAYVRDSWIPGGLVAGVRRGSPVIHAGGQVVFSAMQPTSGEKSPAMPTVTDDGVRARIACASPGGTKLELELNRPGRLRLQREGPGEWSWWCGDGARYEDGTWTWKGAEGTVTMKLAAGRVAHWEPEGYRPELVVGLGKLKLPDPAPRRHPLATLTPDADGRIALEIRTL